MHPAREIPGGRPPRLLAEVRPSVLVADDDEYPIGPLGSADIDPERPLAHGCAWLGPITVWPAGTTITVGSSGETVVGCC